MNCFRCGTANPDGNKFCAACGAPLQLDLFIGGKVQDQVQEELNARLKDGKAITVEITDAIRERVFLWMKLIGLPASLLLAVLSVFGITKVSDILSRKAEIEKMIDNTKNQASQAAELETKVAQDLATLEGRVGDQLKRVNETTASNTEELNELRKRVRELEFERPPAGPGQAPYHLALSSVLEKGEISRIERADQLVFQVMGNTGGVANPDPQNLVAAELTKAFAGGRGNRTPAFLYLLGNIAYYYGQGEDYYAQFYEPYSHYPAPILAIPGNHDGQTHVRPGDSPVGEPTLAAFVRNFCAPISSISPDAKNAPRTSMTQPNSFWTLITPLATIIGLYTNVPEGGYLDPVQQKWLVNELQSAPADRALILAMHHSPYVFSKFTSGSPYMVRELQNAINAARRAPNIVLSATSNLYERIDVTLLSDLKVPFLVIGTGGYRFLHRIGDDTKVGDWDGTHHAQLTAAVDNMHGFVTLEITRTAVEGRFTGVEQVKGAPAPTVRMSDSFRYSARPIVLRSDQKVEWLPESEDSE
jgi:hypothetical protein